MKLKKIIIILIRPTKIHLKMLKFSGSGWYTRTCTQPLEYIVSVLVLKATHQIRGGRDGKNTTKKCNKQKGNRATSTLRLCACCC